MSETKQETNKHTIRVIADGKHLYIRETLNGKSDEQRRIRLSHITGVQEPREQIGVWLGLERGEDIWVERVPFARACELLDAGRGEWSEEWETPVPKPVKFETLAQAMSLWSLPTLPPPAPEKS